MAILFGELKKMKILIADEHPLFRDTATRYITDIQKDSIVLQVCSFTQALKVLEKEQNIDIIVLDMDMLDLPAEQSISKLQNLSESAKIVVISSCECIDHIKKVIKTGIVGYIPRQTDLNVFKQAFENILHGHTYIPKALQDTPAETSEKFTSKKLTNRQSQVLDLIAQGKSNKQIAYEMGVSEATVKLHINALLRSLKVNNRTQAVITAQKIGLI